MLPLSPDPPHSHCLLNTESQNSSHATSQSYFPIFLCSKLTCPSLLGVNFLGQRALSVLTKEPSTWEISYVTPLRHTCMQAVVVPRSASSALHSHWGERPCSCCGLLFGCWRLVLNMTARGRINFGWKRGKGGEEEWQKTEDLWGNRKAVEGTVYFFWMMGWVELDWDS